MKEIGEPTVKRSGPKSVLPGNLMIAAAGFLHYYMGSFGEVRPASEVSLLLTKVTIEAGNDSVRLFLKPFERAPPYSVLIRSTGHRS